MNEGQVKTRIFLIKSVDWALLLAVTAFGIYAVLYSDQPAVMGSIALLGLFFVSKFGNLTSKTIARLRVDMDIDERQRKLKERHE